MKNTNLINTVATTITNTNNKEDSTMFNVIRTDASTPVTLQRIDAPNGKENLSFHDLSIMYSELKTFPRDLIKDIERITVSGYWVTEIVFRGEYMYNVLTDAEGGKYLRNSNSILHREMMIYYNYDDNALEMTPAEHLGRKDNEEYYFLTNSFDTYDDLHDAFVNTFDLPVPPRNLVVWALGVDLRTYPVTQISDHQWHWEEDAEEYIYGEYIYIEKNLSSRGYTLVYRFDDTSDTVWLPNASEVTNYLKQINEHIIWEENTITETKKHNPFTKVEYLTGEKRRQTEFKWSPLPSVEVTLCAIDDENYVMGVRTQTVDDEGVVTDEERVLWGPQSTEGGTWNIETINDYLATTGNFQGFYFDPETCHVVQK